MTAWIQSCFTLVGTGIALQEAWLARQALYPDHPAILSKGNVTTIGLGFVAFGIVLIITAIIQHYIEVRSVQQDDYLHLRSRYLNSVVSISIIIFGILGILAILIG